jgi:uncharacterized protein (TIGR00251 family)
VKAQGFRITFHVQPKASRTELAGKHGDAVKVRIQAPPVDGEANAELLRFVATSLGVSGREVELISGASSRRKVVEVRGVTLAAVEAWAGPL